MKKEEEKKNSWREINLSNNLPKCTIFLLNIQFILTDWFSGQTIPIFFEQCVMKLKKITRKLIRKECAWFELLMSPIFFFEVETANLYSFELGEHLTYAFSTKMTPSIIDSISEQLHYLKDRFFLLNHSPFCLTKQSVSSR